MDYVSCPRSHRVKAVERLLLIAESGVRSTILKRGPQSLGALVLIGLDSPRLSKMLEYCAGIIELLSSHSSHPDDKASRSGRAARGIRCGLTSAVHLQDRVPEPSNER